MLEDLDRANLFVVPLDDQRGGTATTTCSPTRSARGSAPSTPTGPGLHRAASRWYADARPARRRHRARGRRRRRRDGGRPGRGGAARGPTPAPQTALTSSGCSALPEEVVRRRPVLGTAMRVGAAGRGRPRRGRGTAGRRRACASDRDAARAARATRAATTRWRDGARLDRGLPRLGRPGPRRRDGTAEHARRALDAGRARRPLRARWGRRVPRAGRVGGRRPRGRRGDVHQAVASLGAAGNLADELGATVVLANMWLARGRPARPDGCTSAHWRGPRSTRVCRSRPPATCTSASPTCCGSTVTSTPPTTTSGQHRRSARRRRCWRTGTGGTSPRAGLLRAQGDLDGAVAVLDAGRAAVPARVLPRRTPHPRRRRAGPASRRGGWTTPGTGRASTTSPPPTT